jgi:hypothetical protein
LGTVTTVRDTTIGLELVVEAWETLTVVDDVVDDVRGDDVICSELNKLELVVAEMVEVCEVEFAVVALREAEVLLGRGAVTIAVLYCNVA